MTILSRTFDEINPFLETWVIKRHRRQQATLPPNSLQQQRRGFVMRNLARGAEHSRVRVRVIGLNVPYEYQVKLLDQFVTLNLQSEVTYLTRDPSSPVNISNFTLSGFSCCVLPWNGNVRKLGTSS